MPLYNQLKEYRSKLGINQTDLGKMAGVSRPVSYTHLTLPTT